MSWAPFLISLRYRGKRQTSSVARVIDPLDDIDQLITKDVEHAHDEASPKRFVEAVKCWILAPPGHGGNTRDEGLGGRG